MQRLTRVLTESEIVARGAASRRRRREFWSRVYVWHIYIFAGAAVGLLLSMALPSTVSAWAYRHWELWVGLFVGSVGELVMVIAERWTWHRLMWVRWFSH